MEKLELLQKRIGHVFMDEILLKTALTHRSFSSQHNERLEFLGDSILNCVIATLLYERYTDLDEGSLSRLRSSLVRQQALFDTAQKIGISAFLRLGEGELKTGGFNRPSILADTMEALFGAIFLDAGFDTVQQVIRQLFLPFLDTIDLKTSGKDAKTQLQEYLQGRRIALPEYHVVATHGAAHNQEFDVECVIPRLDIRVSGSGSSRRAGEQEAAKQALELIKLIEDGRTVPESRNRKRETQLKLAGIATIQENESADPESSRVQK
jgi:ribonuclease-3